MKDSQPHKETYDVAVIGGGISGFTAAHRLQSKGLKTVVLEKHGQPGGCAGFFSRKGFNFDVGATTLVDFVPEGVGGRYFAEVGLNLPEGEYLDYHCWLPDRRVTLFRDPGSWRKERLEKLGDSKRHRRFWKLMDRTTEAFWQASRNGIKMPMRSARDVIHSVKLIGIGNLPLARFLNTTMEEMLHRHGLRQEKPLCGMLSMLIEDTVHSTLKNAPFINAALGTTIRGAGLMRALGGMKGFWDLILPDYLAKGGHFRRGTSVLRFYREHGKWVLETTRGRLDAGKVISSLPVEQTALLGPQEVRQKLQKYNRRNENQLGGAIVLFLGVPECEVAGQELTHHQLLHTYDTPLGNGNNMFISVSAPGDTRSAPAGHRAVMISTHCGLDEWAGLSPDDYEYQKSEIGNKLLGLARRVYPNLGERPVIFKVGTPATYEKYTGRKDGRVGGYRLSPANANMKAIPQDIGVENFWLVGDSTWPGLGTVAALIGSAFVAKYAAG